MARNKDIGAQLRNQFSYKSENNSRKTKQSDTEKTQPHIEKKEEYFPEEEKRGRPPFDKETRSRRMNILLTPSLYEAVKKTARQQRLSVNEIIFELLEKYVAQQNPPE